MARGARVTLMFFLAAALGFGVSAPAYAGSCGSDSDCAGFGRCSSGQ